MSRFKKLSKTALSSWRPLLILATALTFAGCSDDDSRPNRDAGSLGGGAAFHGAEWATIKNLDPRGEGCVDCHGLSDDMSPYNSGSAHNLGLKNFVADASVQNIKITSAKVEDGKVVVQLNQALPAAVNPSMTFAKLAPRVRHNRGHDWQNYLNAAGNGGTKEAGNVLERGLAPQLARNQTLEIANDRRTLSIKLDDYGWNENHDFSVSYNSGPRGENPGGVASFTGVIGTRIAVPDISEHVYCYEGDETANQINPASSTAVVDGKELDGALLCWWPDGTALPAGVFISDDDHVIVSYEETYTHRVTLLTGAGRPAYNTWFDFVPDGTALPLAYSAESADQNDPASRDVVDIQSCNSCHDSLPLSPGIHGAGGSRSETQVCVTCHNPGNLQARTGRSVDFKQLVHRIHRGNNLPSVSGTVTNISTTENDTGGHGLLSGRATDWTKVRFPQGPTPGTAAGITNCVKCHMGPETNRMVQDLATEIGPGAGFDVQSELKLAKVTPQGDNWLSVRNIEACRACHDSQIWSNTNANIMEASVPLYGSKYLNIGYDWIGFKGANSGTAGNTHNNRTINGNGQFGCGASGGCHGNPSLDTIIVGGGHIPPANGRDPIENTMAESIGDNGSNRVHRRHLLLTRDAIIANRFEVQVVDAKVDATGFSAQVEILDKKTGQPVVDVSAANLGIGTDESFALNAMFGWMANGSPDYNHSAAGGFGGNYNATPVVGSQQPGAPAGLKSVVFNGATGSVSISWADINAALASTGSKVSYNFAEDFDLANSFGTVAVNATLTVDGANYRVRSSNRDFSFADGVLPEGELARRQAVDFLAGNGVEFAHTDGNVQSCSSCHLQLNMHGATASNNTQMCVMCHNPNVTDFRVRSATANLDTDGFIKTDHPDGQFEESEDFKRLIHAVHAAGGKDARDRNQKMRIDPLQTRLAQRPNPDSAGGHSFPGVLSNCQACHIENETGEFAGLWTFDLLQLPKDMIGSSAITGDWANVAVADADGIQHDITKHMKMTPIASVCSSCHDAGYKTSDDGRMNDNNAPEGGPYIGSHWWMQGGIAPGIVAPGEAPKSTKHQSGK